MRDLPEATATAVRFSSSSQLPVQDAAAPLLSDSSLSEIAGLRAQIASLTLQNSALSIEAEAAKEQFAILRNELVEVRSEASSLRSEAGSLRSEAGTLRAESKNYRTELQSRCDAACIAQRELIEANSEIKGLRAQLQEQRRSSVGPGRMAPYNTNDRDILLVALVDAISCAAHQTQNSPLEEITSKLLYYMTPGAAPANADAQVAHSTTRGPSSPRASALEIPIAVGPPASPTEARVVLKVSLRGV